MILNEYMIMIYFYALKRDAYNKQLYLYVYSVLRKFV